MFTQLKVSVFLTNEHPTKLVSHRQPLCGSLPMRHDDSSAGGGSDDGQTIFFPVCFIYGAINVPEMSSAVVIKYEFDPTGTQRD